MRSAVIRIAVGLSLLVSSAAFAFGQEEAADCKQVPVWVQAMHARSWAELSRLRSTGDNSYATQVVFAFRGRELRPTDHGAALALLKLIPHSREETGIWYEFNMPICQNVDFKELEKLGRVEEKQPRAFARAVLVAPEEMRAYVRYSLESVGNPHSDYAQQMARVCRVKHAEFLDAVQDLEADELKWFRTGILEPKGCRALHLPEAD